MPPRNITIIIISAVVSLACYEKALRNHYAATFVEAIRLVDRYYLEEVESRVLFENALTGMADKLDLNSQYLPPKKFTGFQEDLEQRFVGVGIMVEGPTRRSDAKPRHDRLTVVTPLPNGPAIHAGIEAGDVILAIDGKSTEGMFVEESVKLMKGAAGSEVTLTISRAGVENSLEFTLARAEVAVESVLGDTRQDDTSWNYYLEENPRIGYIRVLSFGDLTTGELSQALRFEEHQVDALILDMRYNPGGLLDAAVAACNLFLSSGQIVSTRGRNGEINSNYVADKSTVFDAKLPMVVLVDRESASAAEIVAAALQDNGRAVVVGERSYGKGTVQNIYELEGGASALKLTTANYWRPSGKNIHRLRKPDGETAPESEAWGVKPSEGLEENFTTEKWFKIKLLRRDRDVIRPTGAAPQIKDTNSDAKNGGNDGGNDAGGEPVEDTQLQKAIKYLNEKITQRDAAAQRA